MADSGALRMDRGGQLTTPASSPDRISLSAEQVLAEHLDALYGTAIRLCAGRSADAEDLLQEAAIKVLQRFKELREPRAARAWLFTILTRTHLNRVRSTRRRQETSAEDLDERAFEQALDAWESPEMPDRVLDRQRLRQSLADALDSLDPKLQSIVWLVDVEGFRQREAASMLDIPEGTVASRLFRARRALRDELVGTAADPAVRRQEQEGS